MGFFVEFHLIQNFAPSNLNRDDTGAPKDALFGGYRRARVSSQCFKRAIRLKTNEMSLLPANARGLRTMHLKKLLEERLAELGHKEAGSQIETALAGAGIKVNDKGKTEYLLFLGRGEIEGLAQLIDKYWDSLGNSNNELEKKSKKESKKEAKANLPPELIGQLKKLLDGQKSVDVALFGRMLADMPSVNMDAACQVAHAISTHRVEREFDYFTAVDDEQVEDETGAGMIGQVEFNSATLYRYAVIDALKLASNLQSDKELAIQGIGAFTEALVRAIPTGKQNTFAAHNPPSFVGVVIRHASPFNLSNAFEKPIWPKNEKELTALSVEKLAEHDAKVTQYYGDAKDEWAYLDMTGAWPQEKGETQFNLPSLKEWLEIKLRMELEA